MIPGLSAASFTLVHVVLSLLGIGSGFVVVFGFFTARRLRFWTAFFMTATALACLTGFLLPFHGMTLSLELEIPALAALVLAAADRYTLLFAGMWRHTYVVSVMVALYCGVTALVAQIFVRFLAPTARIPWQYGRLLALTEAAVFVAFAVATYYALKRFRSRPGHKLQ
ncbi:MAG: hypothetical protein WCE75_13310 [Terracidiphilus sp.]